MSRAYACTSAKIPAVSLIQLLRTVRLDQKRSREQAWTANQATDRLTRLVESCVSMR